ncbi:hypothetical protein AD998_09245 [bacterium 336/3]|nr:hypothetical protein AD998_09245 [bacterium 336/3]
MYYLVQNKCPNCHKGKVFEVKNVLFSWGFSKMNEECSFCNFKFDKEPGYFFGAMYVSYGLGMLEGILTYLICHYILNIPKFDWILFIMCSVILSLCFFNFRLSRLIWIYFMKNL